MPRSDYYIRGSKLTLEEVRKKYSLGVFVEVKPEHCPGLKGEARIGRIARVNIDSDGADLWGWVGVRRATSSGKRTTDRWGIGIIELSGSPFLDSTCWMLVNAYQDGDREACLMLAERIFELMGATVTSNKE